MSDDELRLLIIGAHPDDAEFHAGGLSTRYRELGHQVRMISVTDGGAGHHTMSSGNLMARREEEAKAAGAVIGATYETWDFPDAALQPTLELRHRIIAEVRGYHPDLVLTHRPCDYHPDHRAVGQAVQDASYLFTVPLVVPDVPALARDPVVAYMPDLFTRPYAFVPDVVFDIEPHLDKVVDMLACHRSQVFEFLPFNQGVADQVPREETEKITWLRAWYLQWIRPRAERFRTALEHRYGPQRAADIQYMEAFEISEYAASLDESSRQRLFGSV
jgi:LmbE family N-acetylglucosaminyl deacetylase